jgi:anaerobic ribonucleoside-triphosphate reductase activating protein
MATNKEDILLNIAHYSTSTRNLGPGERAVVWVQGCPRNCPGCISPEWIPFKNSRIVTITSLLDKLLISDSIRGLTFSGGEPMEQAEGLSFLIKEARKRMDLDIICFTGYTIERLQSNPPNIGVQKLLKEIDVLIDGPYVKSLNNGIGLRGSSNQRIIHLTTRLQNEMLEKTSRNVDIFLDETEIRMIGIPPLNFESVFQIFNHVTDPVVMEVIHERF